MLLGGKQRRADGWVPLNFLLATCVLAQVGGMGIVVHLFRTDTERFFDGWTLARGLWLCVASWVVEVCVAVGVTVTCLAAEEEAGYELIPEVPRGRRD